MTSSHRGLSKGHAAVFATVVIWSLPAIFQFYLNRFYDPWSQNFYRYLVACLAVAPFVARRLRRGGARLNRAAFLACLLPSIPNAIHQVTQTTALLYIGPGMFAIFMRLSVIVTTLLALIFFADERWIIRQWQFQLGTFFGLAGAVGVFWFQPRGAAHELTARGLLFALTAMICWALYGVLVKQQATRLGSITGFGIISFLTSGILLPFMLAFGRPSTPAHVSWPVNAILVISALLCISLAHVLYYVAIRELGVALAQTLQLLCPVGALALSAVLFGERLGIAQLLSAGVLLLGAFLAMRIKPVTVAATESVER